MKTKTISSYTQDDRNANKGTARGQAMIVDSVQNNGAGRSIVVDKNGVVIGGNKTTNAIIEAMGPDAEVIEIESGGEKLIVHRRNDLDLSDPDPNNPARRLAYQDNLAGSFSFELDTDQVMADIESGFDFEAIDVGVGDLGELLETDIEGLLGGSSPPSLDDLEDEYGEPQERDFWPYIKVQVSPGTFEKWNELIEQMTGEDEAEKFENLLYKVELSL